MIADTTKITNTIFLREGFEVEASNMVEAKVMEDEEVKITEVVITGEE